ncbi:MAG: GspB domain-containing protein [Gammaproteobacteria bacterium]|jgi:general secretion pathway protein B|nr:GspB domain-containing protein [Gammaproteobacteria bacterium]
MSYILEALKKSQQERELGQVPRLQAPMFEEPLEPARVQPWIYVALGLAIIAVMLASYAALRPPMLEPAADPVAVSDVDTAAGDQGAGAMIASAEPEAKPRAGASGTTGPTRNAGDSGPQSAPASSGTDSSLAAADPDDLSVEPQVLVVPAPPKPGERLPRGADELRRAVLGPEASSSIRRREQGPVRAQPAPDHAPVPPELIAEIEQFKRTVQAGDGPAAESDDATAADQERRAQRSESQAPRNRVASRAVNSDASSGRPPPLSSSLRRQLPPFSMTVHVYDPSPTRRFVYLNGSKLREGELSRDGFIVEQIVADGAIFRYDEHRFFQSP